MAVKMRDVGNYEIRYARPEEWEDAMELAWRTFLKFEADEYGEEGKNNFLDFISGEQLFKMFLAGSYKLAVAVYEKEIVGMGSLRTGNHVSLLFVAEEFHRNGIATELLAFLQSDIKKGENCKLTVNASPYGEAFYRKVGFVPTDSMQTVDGIVFLPMECDTVIKTNRL